MRNLNELNQYREHHPLFKQTETSGAFRVFVNGRSFNVIASIDSGADCLYDHVSVVPRNQKHMPTWDEMCAIKRMFFKDDEIAIQIHPKEDEYVNIHERCLHLWRPHDFKW